MMESCVMAGFSSPAEQYIEQALDLNELLVKHPAGSIVIAAVDGESTVKYLHHTDKGVQLLAANPDYPPISFAEGSEIQSNSCSIFAFICVDRYRIAII